MKLPALLPEHLHFVRDIRTDESLLAALKPNTALLVDFFENASIDETWCEQHRDFISLTVEWLTEEYYQDRLAHRFASRITSCLQNHFHVFKTIIPLKLILVVENGEFSMNSLMVGTCSQSLRDIVRLQTNEKGEGKIHPLEDISITRFILFKEYIETNHAEGLWKLEPAELEILMAQATRIDLEGLKGECATVLKRYLTTGNVWSYLQKSQEGLWESLKEYCIQFINAQELGVRIHQTEFEEFAFEFLVFNEETLLIFEKCKHSITQIICSHSLTEDHRFGNVINACPQLVLLNISQTNSYSPILEGIPSSLRELDLSMCSWLSDVSLRKFVKICPNLRRLLLCSNVHLTYRVWAILKEFKSLEELDLSNCHQIFNRDIRVIVRSLPQLRRFSLEHCYEITDDGFIEISAGLPNVVELDLSNTQISDAGLIEIAHRCNALERLVIQRCDRLTEKGIRETMRLAGALKEISLKKSPIPQDVIEKLRKQHTNVRLLD